MRKLKYLLGLLFVSTVVYGAVNKVTETYSLRFNEASPGTNKITVIPPSLAADYTMTLPNSTGVSNQVLSTDGSGVMTWINSTGTMSGPASSVSGALAYFSDTTGTQLAQYTSAPLSRGGTSNIIVAAAGGIGYGTASGISLSLPGASGTFLKSTGTGAPNFAAITLSGDVTGVLGLVNGGTANNISSINGGSVYMTATVMSVTAAGTSGQYLKSEGSAAPIWTSTLLGIVPIVSKTTTYTATVTDDVITATTGSAWTLTLYAASGNAGRVLRIKKTSSDVNALTIDGNASETIDGSTTTTINTQYEEVTIICDGSNWHILSRTYPSVWVQYTPTFSAGFGTATSISVFSRRVGDSLELKGTFATGTVVGSVASMTLGFNGTNANVTLDTTKGASGITHVGQWASGTTTNNFQNNILADSTSTGVIEFGYQNATQAGLTALNGNIAFGNTQGISINATIPISGWK